MKRKILFLQHARVYGGSVVSAREVFKENRRRASEFYYLIIVPNEAIKNVYNELDIPTLILKLAVLQIYSGAPKDRGLRKFLRRFKFAALFTYSVIKLTGLVLRNRPDIVHLNSITLLPYLFLFRILNLPTVLHVRERVDTSQFSYKFWHYWMKFLADRVLYIGEAERMSFPCEQGRVARNFLSTFGSSNLPVKPGCQIVVLSDIQEIKSSLLILEAFTRAKVSNLQLRFVGAQLSLSNPVDEYQKRFKSFFDQHRAELASASKSVVFDPISFDVRPILEDASFLIFWSSAPHFARPAFEALLFDCIPILSKTSWQSTGVESQYCIVGADDTLSSLQSILENPLSDIRTTFPVAQSRAYAEAFFGSSNFDVVLETYSSFY